MAYLFLLTVFAAIIVGHSSLKVHVPAWIWSKMPGDTNRSKKSAEQTTVTDEDRDEILSRENSCASTCGNEYPYFWLLAEEILFDYDEDHLNEGCKSYMLVRNCLKKCNNTEFMRDILLGMNSNMEVKCITQRQEVKKFMPCLTKHSNETVPSCNQKCKKCAILRLELYKYDEVHLSQHPEALKNLTIFFDTFCKYVNCMIACVQQMMSNPCGEGAKPLIEKLYRSLFDFIQNTTMLSLLMKQANVSDHWATNCQTTKGQGCD